MTLWVIGGNPALVSPLQIVAEEVSGTNDYVQLTFRAHKLDNKVGTESRPHSSLLESRGPPTQDESGLLPSHC